MLDSVPIYATVVHVSSLKRFTIWTLGAEVFQILYIWLYLPISESAVYGTNDDALLASISGGQLTGAPDGHLVFINPLISFPISWLQIVFDQLNIFTLFLTFSAKSDFLLLCETPKRCNDVCRAFSLPFIELSLFLHEIQRCATLSVLSVGTA